MTSPVPAPGRLLLAALILNLLPFAPCDAASSSFELNINELEKTAPTQQKKPATKHASTSISKKKPVLHSVPSGYVKYTVKPGDHIFKILIKEFGLSSVEAEKLIPEVAKINNVGNIRNLSIGQTLLIPSAKHNIAKKRHSSPSEQHARKRNKKKTQNLAANIDTPVTPPAAAPIAAPPVQEPPVLVPSEIEPVPAAVPAATLPVIVYEIPAGNAEEMVDGLLKALSIDAEKKRVINTVVGKAGGDVISIKVDRYFEAERKKIIISCSPKDQFNYTLLRILENEGYGVIHAHSGDFRKVAGNLLSHLNRQHDYVVRKSDNSGKDQEGYLTGDGKSGQQVFLMNASGLR